MTPFQDEVEAGYDASAERIRHPDYRMDLKLAAQSNRKGSPSLGALPWGLPPAAFSSYAQCG